jgi:NAD(P)H-hydrate epimerase
MKILPIEKIREADAYTIANEPIASIDLMERAAMQCYNWLRKRIRKKQHVMIFCGLGNNGGDGLVIDRLLAENNYHVDLYIIRYSVKCSEDFQINYDRLKEIKKSVVKDLKDGDALPLIHPDDVVIDAIFGSGLGKPVVGFPARVISHINASEALVVAIDMPSGLFSDEHTDCKAEQ